MIKTLRSVDVLNAIGTIWTLLYSSEPSVKAGTYWWISILSQRTLVNTNKWFQVKEARVSITIVSEHQDNLTTNEEDNIDNIVDIITEKLVDEWCSKISSYGTINALYCNEGDCTTMLYTTWDRAYKIKDFIIWYECHE